MYAIYQYIASGWRIPSLGFKWDSSENFGYIYYEEDKMEMIFKHATEILSVIDSGTKSTRKYCTIISNTFVCSIEMV